MTVTEFRAAFETLTSHGWLTLEEALCLVDWADKTGDKIPTMMVEVGCYHGRSTCLLASLKARVMPNGLGLGYHPAPYRELHCVDPWPDEFSKPAMTGDQSFQRFIQNIREIPSGGRNVCWNRMRIEDWTPIDAGFVYLDGEHTYKGTIAQIEKALACRPQVIAVHDVNDSGGGIEVKRACLELLDPWTERVQRLAVWDRRGK